MAEAEVADAEQLQQETIFGCGWHGKMVGLPRKVLMFMGNMVVVLRETGST